MVSFFLTLSRLVKAIYHSWSDPFFRNNLVLALLMLLSGTLFYWQVEGWRPIDALYFSVATLATVGYGDFHPTTDFSKIFTIIYIFIGIGVFVALFSRLTQTLMKVAEDEASSEKKRTASKDKPPAP